LHSCGNIRGIEILSQKEEDLQKPVVNSSQATTWFALRSLDIMTKIHEFGSLFMKYCEIADLKLWKGGGTRGLSALDEKYGT